MRTLAVRAQSRYELSLQCKMMKEHTIGTKGNDLVAALLRNRLATKLPKDELAILIEEVNAVYTSDDNAQKQAAEGHMDRVKSSIDYIEHKCKEIERSLRASDRHVKPRNCRELFRDRSPLGPLATERPEAARRRAWPPSPRLRSERPSVPNDLTELRSAGGGAARSQGGAELGSTEGMSDDEIDNTEHPITQRNDLWGRRQAARPPLAKLSFGNLDGLMYGGLNPISSTLTSSVRSPGGVNMTGDRSPCLDSYFS